MSRHVHSAPEHRTVARTRPEAATRSGAPPSSMIRFPDHPRRYRDDIPASGAWVAGDPAGRRRFAEVSGGRPFVLDSGATLDEVVVAYETWGTLAADASNAVLVAHALTGDSHAAGPTGPGHASPGWWEGLIGPGRALDTDELFVVCVNVLGGCQGSTGPASIDPRTGERFASSFPSVTIRDMVRTQALLADHLRIAQWKLVVGGSMGGMQVLEWALMFPDRVASIAPLATSMAASAQQIAWSAIGRTAVALDPRFRGGDYYDAEPGDGPHAGLAIARAVAQVTYRSETAYQSRFGRDLVDPKRVYDLWDRFQVESYLDYHGEKLARRFDANSYLVLNRAMDLHDIGRGRGGIDAAMGRLRCPVVSLSISSDGLYPPHQQRDLVDAAAAGGGVAELVMVDSDEGHDGFLIEFKEVGAAVRRALELAEEYR